MAHRLQIRSSLHHYDTQGLGGNASGSNFSSLLRQGVMLPTLRFLDQTVLCGAFVA